MVGPSQVVGANPSLDSFEALRSRMASQPGHGVKGIQVDSDRSIRFGLSGIGAAALVPLAMAGAIAGGQLLDGAKNVLNRVDTASVPSALGQTSTSCAYPGVKDYTNLIARRVNPDESVSVLGPRIGSGADNRICPGASGVVIQFGVFNNSSNIIEGHELRIGVPEDVSPGTPAGTLNYPPSGDLTLPLPEYERHLEPDGTYNYSRFVPQVTDYDRSTNSVRMSPTLPILPGEVQTFTIKVDTGKTPTVNNVLRVDYIGSDGLTASGNLCFHAYAPLSVGLSPDQKMKILDGFPQGISGNSADQVCDAINASNSYQSDGLSGGAGGSDTQYKVKTPVKNNWSPDTTKRKVLSRVVRRGRSLVLYMRLNPQQNLHVIRGRGNGAKSKGAARIAFRLPKGIDTVNQATRREDKRGNVVVDLPKSLTGKKIARVSIPIRGKSTRVKAFLNKAPRSFSARLLSPRKNVVTRGTKTDENGVTRTVYRTSSGVRPLPFRIGK